MTTAENKLPKTMFDGRTGEKLVLVKDYYIPEWCLAYEKHYQENPPTKYMTDRTQFLLSNHEVKYSIMMCKGKLEEHLIAIDKEATEMEETLTAQMMKKQGVTEELKRRNQMEWVGKMNNIKACVREIIYDEIIYKPL